MKTLLQWKNFWPQAVIKISMLAAISCLCGSGTAWAQGTLTWNWTYSGRGAGSNINGSGTLTTDASTTTSGGNTGYLITGITGTWNPDFLGGSSGTITGLLNAGTLNSAADGTPNDNLLLGASTPQLDDGGFAFSTATGNYSISYYSGQDNYWAGFPGSGSSGTFSATLATPTPEPSTTALLVMAAGSLFFIGRLKPRLA